MIFGCVCLGLSLVSVIMCAVCGRAADDSLALPMFFVFLTLLVAGILSVAFDSYIVGIVAIVLIASWICNAFWP